MNRVHASSLAGLITVLVLLPILALRWAAEPAQQPNKRPAHGQEKPVPMAANLVQLQIALGQKDKQPTDWRGEIRLSQGKVRSLEVVSGNPKAKAAGTKFLVKSVLKKKKAQQLLRPVLRVLLEAPPAAQVTVATAQGNFTFALADISTDKVSRFLAGRAVVERLESAVLLTGPETEDDYPALARGPNNTAWLVHNEYLPGPPLIKERVLAGNFEGLVPTGNGDQILLRQFDGRVWDSTLEVTEPGLNVWRPTVAIDGRGRVVVAWSQQEQGNWDIYYRTFRPGKSGTPGTWSKTVRLTNDPGSDFHVVAATDANGVVWLAWQAWRDGHFQIQLLALRDNPPNAAPTVVSTSKTNNWGPAIAADSRGNVYVAWDSYDGDSYNVHLHRVGNPAKAFTVAASPRFEARPSIVCDARDNVWIAYEEGNEQWGKDYTNATPIKVGMAKNPGFPLYLKRTVRVKCLVGDTLKEPAGDLQKILDATLPRNRSLPRLAVDASGGVWLWLRQHPLPTGAGEVWDSYALRYNGRTWSRPRHIGNSDNVLDSRPALVAHQDGILEVHAGDYRLRTQNRGQSDLFAVLVKSPNQARVEHHLIDDRPITERAVPPVHPNEAEQVARLRQYRIDYNGKKLHLIRGEFHRHTEYTSHNDGDGTLEDQWRYALDAGNLDWMGNGDHDNGFGHEYPWWQIQKYTDIMHNPPHFLGALTYERSVVYPNGHRNVMMPRRGIRPLPRGVLKGSPEKGTPDTRTLYAYLKHFGGICSSHTSATDMGTDWRDNDPVLEPVVEIYQGHRHNYEYFGAPKSATKETQIGGFEPAGFIDNALKMGHKFGFQSSSDHVSTHLSYGMVLTADLSRQGIIDAFKQRHCYAATDNILLEVRSGTHLMGDVFATGAPPALEIRVQGTAPVARLHVMRNNKTVQTLQPGKADVNLRYTDPQPLQGRSSYYYVRVEQADGNLAWSSPMWITYSPKK